MDLTKLGFRGNSKIMHSPHNFNPSLLISACCALVRSWAVVCNICEAEKLGFSIGRILLLHTYHFLPGFLERQEHTSVHLTLTAN